MLSIEECRKLIKGSRKYSDEEIEKIRADLYEFTDIILDYLEGEGQENKKSKEYAKKVK